VEGGGKLLGSLFDHHFGGSNGIGQSQSGSQFRQILNCDWPDCKVLTAFSPSERNIIIRKKKRGFVLSSFIRLVRI
jgi:hypothetical protein